MRSREKYLAALQFGLAVAIAIAAIMAGPFLSHQEAAQVRREFSGDEWLASGHS
jgi:hypothetical protein